MTKVTIDSAEYDTDTFNEEQNSLLHQLQNNQNVSAQVQYQLHALQVLKDLLSKKLRKLLDDNK